MSIREWFFFVYIYWVLVVNYCVSVMEVIVVDDYGCVLFYWCYIFDKGLLVFEEYSCSINDKVFFLNWLLLVVFICLYDWLIKLKMFC